MQRTEDLQRPTTVQDAAQLALVAERKNDILKLLEELHSIIPILQRELDESSFSSANISQNPVVRLYVDQMYHLVHRCLNGHALEKHLRAVDDCKKIAQGDSPMRQLAMLELFGAHTAEMQSTR